MLEKRSFVLNNRYDSLVRKLEEDDPKYYRMKYDNKVIGLSQLKEKLVGNTALIEYFEPDSILYTFVITRDSSNIFIESKGSDFQDHIITLRSSLNPRNKVSSSNTFSKFTSTTSHLEQLPLDRPLQCLARQKNINQLMIVPHGKLSYLPFELLLLTKANSFKYTEMQELLEQLED